MDHSSWDWEAYGWCNGEIMQLGISLRQSGVFWAKTVLGFAFKHPSLVFVGTSTNSTNSRSLSPFHDSEILQSHSVMFLPSTETKLLGEWPPHWILEFYHRVSRSSREFLPPPLRTAVELCFGRFAAASQLQAKLFRCFALRNWILCREQWIAYILSFSSICQVMQSLLSGSLVRNPHRVVFLRSASNRSSKVLSSASP